MTRVPMTQAVAADYADAMLVARRAKNVLFLLLMLILLLQLGFFFVVRYVPNVQVHVETTSISAATPSATTEPSTTQNITMLDRTSGQRQLWSPVIEQFIAILDFGGVLFAIVLPVVLLLVVAIMLVGRLVGVSHVTSAFCWSIVFLVILFPWQSLLNSTVRSTVQPTSLATASSSASSTSDVPDIRIPGVLYTFPELCRDYNFPNNPWKPASLKWARYVGFPVVELILLLMIQVRGSRGLRFALGEAELPTLEVAPHTPI